MVASVVALLIGSRLSVVNNSMYPSLPLEILRQSTLGGGIIDSIVGGGTLSVPTGALGTAAVAQMTVPLHPLAVAGYIGLIINSLSLLPIGSKYYWGLAFLLLRCTCPLTQWLYSYGWWKGGLDYFWTKYKGFYWFLLPDCIICCWLCGIRPFLVLFLVCDCIRNGK